MKKMPLALLFCLTLFFALYGTLFFPNMRFMAFSPFLACLFQRSSLLSSLWMASLCGLLMDLTSSELRFGTIALIYCFTTLVLYRQKHHFFEEKLLSLLFFSTLISITLSFGHLLSLFLFVEEFPLTFSLFCTDVLYMSLFDALYAFALFTLVTVLRYKGWYKFFRSSYN